MGMGLIFMNFTPTKAATNRKQLIKNCHGFSWGVEKFSAVHSNRVAAASRPTTAGRRPVKTEVTLRVCMYRINILLISIMRMSDGNTSAKVAMALPATAIGTE